MREQTCKRYTKVLLQILLTSSLAFICPLSIMAWREGGDKEYIDRDMEFSPMQDPIDSISSSALQPLVMALSNILMN